MQTSIVDLMVGKLRLSVRAMVLNATLNNISAISWWLVLLEEEIGVPGEIKFTGDASTTLQLSPHWHCNE